MEKIIDPVEPTITDPETGKPVAASEFYKNKEVSPLDAPKDLSANESGVDASYTGTFAAVDVNNPALNSVGVSGSTSGGTKVSDVANSVSGAVSNAASSVSGVASDAVNSVSNVISGVSDSIVDTTKDLAEKIRDLFTDLATKLNNNDLFKNPIVQKLARVAASVAITAVIMGLSMLRDSMKDLKDEIKKD